MEKKLARAFSIMFHPLIMTSLGLFIMFNSGSSLSVVQPEVKRVSMIVVFMFTCIFPVGLVIMLYLTRMISDPELSGRKERFIPMAIIAILLFFTFFVMRSIPQLERGHTAFLLSAAVSILLILLLNRFIKPSVHMAGLGLVLGMMFFIIVFYRAPLQVLFIACILAAGITGSAQLILKSHTRTELAAGFLAGFFVTLTVMLIFLI